MLDIDLLDFFYILNNWLLHNYLNNFLNNLKDDLRDWNLNNLKNWLFNNYYLLNYLWHFHDFLHYTRYHNNLFNNLFNLNNTRNFHNFLYNFLNNLLLNSNYLFLNNNWHRSLDFDLFYNLFFHWNQFNFFNLKLSNFF